MKVYKMIFSPTSTGAKAANTLAKKLADIVEAEELINIDLSDAAFEGCSLEKDSLAVVVMPSYGGRAPKVAIERLAKVEGNGSKIIPIVVYGNRAQEDTLIEMADVAEKSGFQVIAGIEAVAEHSIAHQYAAGRPDKDDLALLETYAAKIAEKLKKDPDKAPKIPGNRPYKKAGGGLVPKTTSACTNCGFCVDRCPVGAIDREHAYLTDKNKCINCMRCTKFCPKHARTVNKLMVAAVGLVLWKDCHKRKEYQLFL